MKTLVLAFFASFLNFTVLFAQSDLLVGTFSNAQTGLQLTLDNNFTGQFALQGQSFPAQAEKITEEMVLGTYTFNGYDVPFSLILLEGQFTLVSEGMEIAMTKQSAGNAIKPNIQNNNTTTNSTNLASADQNVPKATGERLGDEFAGFQFNAPAGWVSQAANGGYIIGHQSKWGFIMVQPHNYKDKATIIQESSQGLVDGTTQLYLENKIENYGTNGLIGQFSGTMEGQAAKAISISLLSPHGGGLSITAGVSSAKFSQEYVDLVKSIANSVVFSKPKTSPLANQWQQRLTGKKLVYYYTGNGMSEKWKIILYANGQFYNSQNSSYSSSDAISDFSSASQNKGMGTWTIRAQGQGATLILNHTDGSVAQYSITPGDSNGKVMLNGERYFITDLNSEY